MAVQVRKQQMWWRMRTTLRGSPPQVSRGRQSGDPAVNPLRLVRLRLRLALLTMAVAPTALTVTILRASFGSNASGVTTDVLVAMVVLTALLIALTAWMSKQILIPAEQLERSRIELSKKYEIAREDSLSDALTGLGNHRAFQEELDRELEMYQRYHVPVALLLIDLDDLKQVNDSEGHAAGDARLRQMGQIIADVTRYADRSFRIGGDEFALLMPHTDSEAAMEIAHRLLERGLKSDGATQPLCFSGGISACPEFASTRTQLYAQADSALYWCKRHGRASVDVFHPGRDRATTEATANTTSGQLARVVSEGLIRPAYQPIIDLTTGRVLGFEGLSRPNPESGFADPAAMFAAAAAVGRTVELDLACLHAVIEGARSMPAHQVLTINLSPRTVEAPHFSTEALLSILSRYDMPPGRVVVELTERENVEDIPRLQTVLAALKRSGVRIAADDVGAGNAGLRLLSQFRFDIVKIDLSLVQDEHETSRAVLRSLRELAGRWGASAIAEGVETATQLQTVRELDIPAGQGYLLARPMPQPTLTSIDLAPLQAGGAILDWRIPQPRHGSERVRAQPA